MIFWKYAHYSVILSWLLAAQAALGQVPINPLPSRAVGHPRLALSSVAPNLVEGRELNSPGGIAVDTVNNIIYVADSANSRVLAWRNATGFENGAPADFVVGQRDKLGTFNLGPGTTLSSGLSVPSGLAVDRQGNLYVADSGNNRIVRYSTPFTGDDAAVRLADFAIGQPSLTSRARNFTGNPSERSLNLTDGSNRAFRAGLLFDSQGNLWVTDSGNNRVLRYPAASLGDGAQLGPSANLVLGQPDFQTTAPLGISGENRISKSRLLNPSSIAFDQGGRLFVTDALNRVLVYSPPFNNGIDAVRIMGVVVLAQGATPPPIVNEINLGISTTGGFQPPEGVFTIGNIPFVIDTPSHRILRYDPFDQWPAEGTSFSPPARATIGQDAAQQAAPLANRGQAEPNPGTFAFPTAGVFAAGQTFIVDSGNNRVLAFPDLSTGPPLSSGEPYRARRVLGQPTFDYRANNYLEGREFAFGGLDVVDGREISLFSAAGVAIDRRSNPPRLYVADPGNNRILGFADARSVRPGDRADIVIGQPDCFRRVVNYPSNSTTQRSAASLNFPVGVTVDAEGNLWVADNGNGRVLRFPSPFTSGAPTCAGGTPLAANLVLGQSNFTARATDATDRTMTAPFGLAFSADGHLFVSDAVHNRVLLFNQPLSNGKPATRAFGQADFDSTGTGSALNRLNSPRHISVDTDDRLYVADSANNRIVIFSRAPSAGPDPSAAFTLAGLSNPQGIFVSSLSGDIWVANSGASGTNSVLRYPKFDTLTTGGANPNYGITGNGALAIALDSFDNVVLAEATHRVALYFPVVNAVNAANYVPRLASTQFGGGATPGMIASLFPINYSFTDQTADFGGQLPVPTVVGDIQVLVNDTPSPIFLVTPGQINFVVPMNAPTSGTAEFQVIQVSTGRVIAAVPIPMAPQSPGLFTSNASGSGFVAANNEDGSIHSLTNRAAQRSVMVLYGTGQGFIPGAPPDGVPTTGPLETPDRPRVFVNARECEVLYSGLAPGLVGVWQINIRLDANLVQTGEFPIVVSMRDTPSVIPTNPNLIRPTVAIR